MDYPKNNINYVKRIMYIIILFISNYAYGQNKIYNIGITNSSKVIISNGLDLGGNDNKGNLISLNNYFISYNSKQIINNRKISF